MNWKRTFSPFRGSTAKRGGGLTQHLFSYMLNLVKLKKTSKIPLTIITGFLGAGKTTFINFLLRNYPETQFALVENEFGEVAIDTKLVKGIDASQMFELKQGCICCTITDEFELVLQELADRFPNVEHLLIETTGVADPGSVVQPFFRDENLKQIYHFNGTVCLVDAQNFDAHPEREITMKQLVIADFILVNKSEDLETEQKGLLQKEIENINPFAQICFVQYGEPTDFRLENTRTKTNTEFNFLSRSVLHSHIQTKTLTFNQSVNKEAFLRWFSYTLDIYKNQIYRTKGILCFQNEPFEYILQGVGGNFELIEGDIIVEKAKSELVFIGRLKGLDLEFPF